jgi:hypothetical protein
MKLIPPKPSNLPKKIPLNRPKPTSQLLPNRVAKVEKLS